MPDLLISNLDDATLGYLTAQAAVHGVTVPEEARAILAQARQLSWTEFAEESRRLRDELLGQGVRLQNTAALIREDRER